MLEYEKTFLFPAYLFEELEKHKTELMVKSRLKEDEFNNLLYLLLKKTSIVPNGVIHPP